MYWKTASYKRIHCSRLGKKVLVKVNHFNPFYLTPKNIPELCCENDYNCKDSKCLLVGGKEYYIDIPY